jgi:glucosamine 6-phosphate synthetase-like amidotransferase/phosphosugar isomerase protein
MTIPAPTYVSSEIGNVDASTIAVTFSEPVTANRFADGVTVQVNGTETAVLSTSQPTDKRVVYYVIDATVISTDVVTWRYVTSPKPDTSRIFGYNSLWVKP